MVFQEEYGVDFEQQQQQEAAPPAPSHHVETVTTTVEVRRSPNGDVVEVINEEQRVEEVIDVDQPMPAAEANADGGVSEMVAQEQIQILPQLFDMDLERMHLDLYRDKYLVPDDFLDDIRKIVHNANARANEDPDRLFRAQAMLTAAEVSIQEFDANFRLECQRMAGRELKRREEYRRSRAEKKASEEPPNGAQNQPIRRSARHNGQQPELPITDPLKLERRLKRARSTGADAEPSEEEPVDEAHAAKRSRVSSAEVDGQESVVANPDGLVPPRSHAVRFIDDVSQKEVPSTPTPHANDFLSELPAHSQGETEQSPRKAAGFDPALLNPMSPDTEQKTYTLLTPTRSLSELPALMSPVRAASAAPSVPPSVPNGVVDPGVPPPQTRDQEMPINIEADTAMNEVPRTPVPEPQPEPMVIERTPTPLPDFVVSEDEVAQLKVDLRDKTEPLNVEELEQLRAACLALVWKHRSEWDRSALIRELRQTVERYVDEVGLDDMDSSYEA